MTNLVAAWKQNVHIEILLWTVDFPVMPKGIQVQEGLGTGGTCNLTPNDLYTHVHR